MEYCNQIGGPVVTEVSISKFYKIIRNKLKKKIHKIWNKSFLGVEINTSLCYSSVEIDESKIISSDDEIYWIFGLVDRQTKEARIRCILNNRTKQKLLPIVKKIYIAMLMMKKWI